MVVEVDQSGKLEQLDTGTAVAFSNGKNGVIWIKAGIKRTVVNRLRKSLIPSIDLWPVLFGIIVWILIQDLPNNIVVRIDEEYTGKEVIIRETLEKLLLKRFGVKWKGEIRFGRIGKKSRAHLLAWKVHRDKNRQKARRLTVEDILNVVR